MEFGCGASQHLTPLPLAIAVLGRWSNAARIQPLGASASAESVASGTEVLAGGGQAHGLTIGTVCGDGGRIGALASFTVTVSPVETMLSCST